MPKVNNSANRLGSGPAADVGGVLEQAVALHRDGNPSAALALYDCHLQVHPDDAEALFLAATAHFQCDEAAIAEPLYCRAAEIAPDVAQVHNNHGLALDALGRHSEALDAYCRALECDPNLVEALNSKGTNLSHLGRFGEAIDVLRKAIRLAPDLAVAHDSLGIALTAEGESESAIASFRQALAIDPRHSDAHAHLCYLLLEKGQGDQALLACDDYLRAFAGYSRAIALKTVALRQLGRVTDAESIIDFDHLFRCQHQIQVPDSYGTLAAFNDALCNFVHAHPTLNRDPKGRALRLGWRSGGLIDGVNDAGPVAVLAQVVRGAVAQYSAAIQQCPDHPFQVPTHLEVSHINMWATVMERGGHETTHCHPVGWLSGIYYPRVPESVAASTVEKRGWIGFGRTPEQYPIPQRTDVRWILPTEGMLLLMPSYYYHETKPLAGDESRVSIAFDVVLPEV